MEGQILCLFPQLEKYSTRPFSLSCRVVSRQLSH
jgi:hypothetical protein